MKHTTSKRFAHDHYVATFASRKPSNVDYSTIKVGDVLTLTKWGEPFGTKMSGTLVEVHKVTKKTITVSNNIKVSTDEGAAVGLADGKHGKAGYRINN